MVKTGDTLVVDGREGIVEINPDAEHVSAYKKLEREFVHLQGQLAENRDQPAKTLDGESLSLLANINSVADSRTACAMGEDGSVSSGKPGSARTVACDRGGKGYPTCP